MSATARTLLRSIRPPFLLMTLSSVFLGFATALASGARIDSLDAWLALLGALCAHISVNTFNEYFDFRSGLDTRTERTPFSGGSGALPDNPAAAGAVLGLAIIALGLTVLAGVYFIFRHGPLILPVGLLGVVIIITYTQWLNRYPLLCLLAPGVGFGPLMVVGTYFVLTGGYSPPALFVSLVPFFLASNLLLLNQYPDIDADAAVGRRHLPAAYGVEVSNAVYGGFAVAAGLTIIAAVELDYLPGIARTALLPLAAAFVAWSGAVRHARSVARLLPYLAMNALAAGLTPVVLGVTLLLA
jgi:1,4-dihydroxy-2-naphthoate octaprenyltransferase